MKILIVVATRQELSPLIEYFHLPEGEFLQSDAFDILVTGVGIAATAYALGRYLHLKYDLVLNLGIAGSFDRNILLGSVVNIVSDTFSELGAEDGEAFISIDELGFGRSQFTSQHSSTLHSISDLQKCNGITVNTVHGNDLTIEKIIKSVRPTTESMEGAAVLYCCEKAVVPCLQIRAISNYVERRNKDNWQIGLAIKNLNNWAIGFLTNT
ncbi:futalosine hydrolase [Pedobacter sp. PWIIR3]